MNTKKKYYIGINASYHDAAISLVNDCGEVVYAQATERYTQNKRSLFSIADDFGFIENLISKYNIEDYEISTNWVEFKSIGLQFFFTLFTFDEINNVGFFNWLSIKISGIKNKKMIHFHNLPFFVNHNLRNISGQVFKFFLNYRISVPYKKTINFNHHLCHAYHSFFTSPYKSALVLVIDGSGDYGKSISLYKGEDQSINLVKLSKNNISLGALYYIITELCGMDSFKGEEWKVMGMASYGEINETVLSDLKKLLWIEKTGVIRKKKEWIDFYNTKLWSSKYNNIDIKDIAFTGQFYFEQLLIELINNIYKEFPHENLIIAGGCALNSSAIGKLHYKTPYKNIFVPNAPADDGCAIGSALLNFKKHNPIIRIPNNQKSPFIGDEIEDNAFALFYKYSHYKKKTVSYQVLYSIISNELFEGKIIAWVQGRAEFGARALGNRSILASPCLPSMKDKINKDVKFREEFRPFAPAILEEFASDYFEEYFPTPYMERVLKIKLEKQILIPAVTHVDGTGRLQTVTNDFNPHFYNLISEFYKLSGVPVLLNTSLNVMGKPIVNSVNDIAGVFATSGLDILVINNTIFWKE